MNRVVRIHRSNTDSWKVMPYLLTRMANFTQTYDPEGLPEETVDLARGWFTTGDMRLGLWVVIDNTDSIIGHLFVTPEPLGLELGQFRFGLVRQALVDAGVDLRKEAREAFEQALSWLSSLGLNTVMMLSHRSDRAFARSWGFEPYKQLFIRPIRLEK